MYSNMKRILFIVAFALCALPLFGQKMTKEEKAAAAKVRYEAALESINAKTFVIIPSEYMTADGEAVSNIDNNVFLSVEGEQAFGQGHCVTDNKYDNVADISSYDVKVDKKGNVKITMVVSGRMWRGTYKISLRNGDNAADVIFNPASGTTRRFSGPVTPVVGSDYNKRTHPI